MKESSKESATIYEKIEKYCVETISPYYYAIFSVIYSSYTVVTSSILHNQSIQDSESSAIDNTELYASKMSDRFKKTNDMLHTTKHIFETLQAQGNLTANEAITVIENNLKNNTDAIWNGCYI